MTEPSLRHLCLEVARCGCLGLSSALSCMPGYPLLGRVKSTDHAALIAQVQVAGLAKPLISFASSCRPGAVWEGRGSCSQILLPCRHVEARSFYTYYLRTLSGVTRGSYKLNTTVGAANETNTSQPKRADRSDLPLCHFVAVGGWGWCREEVPWPWVGNGLGLCLSPGKNPELWLGPSGCGLMG